MPSLCHWQPWTAEAIKETAMTTALHPPKWLFRCVDSHARLKKDRLFCFVLFFLVCLFFFFFSPALVSQKIGGDHVRYSLVWETFHPRLKGKRAQESRRAKAVLRENNYTSCFINECERALATKPTKPITNAFVVLPYVLCVSERISRLLKQQSLQVSNKPQRTTEGLFSTTKTTGWN